MTKLEPDADLVAMVDDARQLRAQADEIEEKAIRLAFERAGWFEARAAQLLGIARQSLQGLIGPRGRLREFGAEARQRRDKAGIGRGRPPKNADHEA